MPPTQLAHTFKEAWHQPQHERMCLMEVSVVHDNRLHLLSSSSTRYVRREVPFSCQTLFDEYEHANGGLQTRATFISTHSVQL